jgi:CheY-like chemotaxis protein
MNENEQLATVLVVDDEPIVRDVVSRYLERDGHTVMRAPTAKPPASCSSANSRPWSSST